MLGPFATDMYLPAFPAMSRELAVSASTIQLTLTTFFVGVSLGQLLFGPLSDRVGRKPPLIVGSAICLVASVVCAWAPTVEILLGARFVQGFTGAAGMVIARAIVADLHVGAAAARMFSLLMMLGSVAPVIAPLAGGLLAGPIGWRGILWVLAAFTLLSLLAVLLVIPETHAPAAPGGRRPHGIPPRAGMGTLARRKAFMAHALIPTFSFAVLMGYIAASPFIFQTIMGLGVLSSGILFAVNSAALFVGNGINARFVGRYGQHRLLRVGLVLLTAAAALLALVVVVDLPVWFVEIPLLLITSCVGLLFGNAAALALGHASDGRGSGSALMGALQFGAGAAVAPLVGLMGPSSLTPLAIVAVVGVAICWGLYRIGVRIGPAHS